MAAAQSFLSPGFCFFYAMIILLLGFYAVCWQQIIKHIPLSTAYANKAVTVIWGLIWGILFFGENITIGKLAGVLMVVCGIMLFAYSDNTKNDKVDDTHEE